MLWLCEYLEHVFHLLPDLSKVLEHVFQYQPNPLVSSRNLNYVSIRFNIGKYKYRFRQLHFISIFIIHTITRCKLLHRSVPHEMKGCYLGMTY